MGLQVLPYSKDFELGPEAYSPYPKKTSDHLPHSGEMINQHRTLGVRGWRTVSP